ncbi:MAG: hypothetical protein RMJ97_10700 [Raineya sp.]|nr:hypothetical protein [Raineya sp.]
MKKILYITFLAVSFYACDVVQQSDSQMKSNTTGKAGSLARFAIQGNRLYIVDKTSLITMDISNPSEPQQTHRTHIGFGIETIFPYQDKLFIGATDAMYIYDFTNPDRPELLSRYSHITACDPVVAQGNYAYVTLRSGAGMCPRPIDELHILDISNAKDPLLKKVIPMQNPHGLGISGNNLFVCEGNFGLKRFDISNPIEPQQIEFLQDIASFDVIPKNQLLVVVGKKGLYQYDFSQTPMQRLSFIPAKQN